MLRADTLKGTTGEPAIPFDMVSGRRFRPFLGELAHHLLNDLDRPLC